MVKTNVIQQFKLFPEGLRKVEAKEAHDFTVARDGRPVRRQRKLKYALVDRQVKDAAEKLGTI